MFDYIKPLIGSLASFAKKRMGFQHPPRLFLKQDLENGNKALGRTAYYDPQEQSVTLYITARHPKDILRSFSHELVHHTQNLRGDLSPEKIGMMTKNYAQDNDHMRNMEKEAYLQGNMCFRDWEDTIEDKDKILIKLAESKFLKENKTMTTKITKQFLEEEIKRVLEQFAGVGLEDITTADPIAAAKSAIEMMNKTNPIVPNFKAIKATHAALLKMNTKEADETALEYLAAAMKRTRGFGPRTALGKLQKKTTAQMAARVEQAKQMKQAANLKRLQKAAAERKAKASKAEKGIYNVLNVKEENEELEEKKGKKSKAKKFAMNQKPYDKATALDRKGDDGVSKKIKMKAIAEEEASMVDAEKALYEERFGNRNKKLFEHLVKNWTK